ncbi:MAG: glycosyltransferase [Clostridia bacterium]|nr:glycosyltransferase [Clostridia bacterium]
MSNKREIIKTEQHSKVHILKRFIYSITVILTIIYLVFRVIYTLPIKLGWIGLTMSIIVLLLEVWESFDFFTYYLNILRAEKNSPQTPVVQDTNQYPDVDVLIATLNESEDIIKNTIEACINMEYPAKSKIHIYVCDDGNRKNVKKLSESMGVQYITRLTNKDAKSGNYNHALQVISSPYVATFDADMAPTTKFLMKTIPFFIKGKNIGFVQLPQSFKNPDIFQLRYGLSSKIPFEQDYFYHSIQIAKNETNSVIFCGTNAVFSREALDSVGGFAKNTISEDIATGMLIESKKYKGIALNDVEAYGMAVNDVTGFIKQRSRWARGCVQILKNYRILNNKGLTFKQKLEYLSCVSYWFFGLKRMIYMVAPLLFSIFGIIIVDCNLIDFIAFWLPMYILKRIAIDILENNKRSATWNKIYETVLAPTLCKEVVKELLGFGNTRFDVTPKGAISYKMTKTQIKLLVGHLALLLLSVIGCCMSIFKISSEGFYVYILSLLWLMSNVFYLTTAVIFDFSNRRKVPKEFVPNKVKRFGRLSSLRIFF